MRVIDSVTGQRLTADEAYERFFDGFYNLGRPSEIFQGTMVLSPPKHERVETGRRAGTRRSGMTRRGRGYLTAHK
jgi:hypothetical protein